MMRSVETKQNAQLTFKYNNSMARHGWLRLTPAYSVKLVEAVLSELDYAPACVLEPFSGTGTTELVCANLGIPSVAYDINPFLVWFAQVKTRVYPAVVPYQLQAACARLTAAFESLAPSPYPPIANIDRWWGESQLEFLAKLKTGIWATDDQAVRDLLKVAFCRILIALSNAAFNHVSTSFQDGQAEAFDARGALEQFACICLDIAQTLDIQPAAQARVYRGDSTHLPGGLAFDTVITSPPYPNRISYIRELRPYMYWLDYLKTADDASQLDWATIGGTWGAATSRLAAWQAMSDALPPYLIDVASAIRGADNRSAALMANYVLKYFEDMSRHFESVFEHLAPGGTVHYIVGNSSFYGNTVPSEKIYVDLMTRAGFSRAQYKVVRKRNSNKALYEYIVSAQKA